MWEAIYESAERNTPDGNRKGYVYSSVGNLKSQTDEGQTWISQSYESVASSNSGFRRYSECRCGTSVPFSFDGFGQLGK
jgi:hypothetical protein